VSAVLDLPGVTEESWQEEAYRRGWGDGLPLVAPTPARVAAALAALDGIDLELGPLPPSGLVPTRESFAANAVMAGCRPADLPVVLAAVRALQAPEYNLHGVLATTHPCAPMVVVSGPVRAELGVNSGANCLGQGTRANAVIGRRCSWSPRTSAGRGRASWTGRRRAVRRSTPSASARTRRRAPSRRSRCAAASRGGSRW
jgi:hypothetical protein